MIRRMLAVVMCLSLTAVAVSAQGQNKTTTAVPVVGNFYEPAKLEPADERVQTLRLPAGFRINKFAEMSNPRMITSMLPEMQSVTNRIAVRSDSFGDNQPIPEMHTAYGQDASPQLSWSGVPSGAKSLVVMMEDPDAASPKPFTHWLIANIAPNVTSLPAMLPKSDKPASVRGTTQTAQGATNLSNIGYYGPKPPAGDPPHRYHFQLFALDTVLDLPSGYNRQALLERMKGHVLAKGALVGTFQRK